MGHCQVLIFVSVCCFGFWLVYFRRKNGNGTKIVLEAHSRSGPFWVTVPPPQSSPGNCPTLSKSTVASQLMQVILELPFLTRKWGQGACPLQPGPAGAPVSATVSQESSGEMAAAVGVAAAAAGQTPEYTFPLLAGCGPLAEPSAVKTARLPQTEGGPSRKQ